MGTGRQFILFVMVGGFAALVNITSRALLSTIMAFEIAIILAYLVAMLVAFALSKRFVFDTSGRSAGEELVKFALVNVVALLQVWLVSVFLKYVALPAIGWTFQPELIAHTAGVASPIFTSYFGHKYFSFRAKSKPDGENHSTATGKRVG